MENNAEINGNLSNIMRLIQLFVLLLITSALLISCSKDKKTLQIQLDRCMQENASLKTELATTNTQVDNVKTHEAEVELNSTGHMFILLIFAFGIIVFNNLIWLIIYRRK